MLKKLFRELLRNEKAAILILVGALSWSLTMVKSGLVYPFGLGFWGPNGHDGVWHIALINSLTRGSWQMPIFSGESIKNYHIGFDLLIAFIHKLTTIPITILYFQIIPPILAVGIGFFVYLFTLSWTKSKLSAWWATFFVYFGGGWGWVVTLIRNQKLGGESLFWSQQSISTLINPPFALSLVFVFAGLFFLIQGLKSQEKNRVSRYLLIATFLFGVLVQIKVYAGILMIVALFISGFWRMVKGKGISLIKVALGASIVSILIFSPVTQGIEKNLIFKPFWFLETMMVFPDRFYWSKLGEAMVNYKLAGNWTKGIPAYLLTFAIFWFGNLGTRVFKELLFFKHMINFRKLTYIEVLFYVVIGLGVIIPTFFIQSGNSWNSIQFMYYSLVFSGVLAGIAVAGWMEGKAEVVKTTASVILVGLTIPTTFASLGYHYLPARPPAKISNQEVEALKFLRKQPDGVVLTLSFDRNAANAAISNPPRPLYLYESTAYVSAFSGKPVYFEDEVNLEITGYDWIKRREDLEEVLSNSDTSNFMKFLRKNNISYLYFVNENYRNELTLELVKIFANDEVEIYKTPN